MKKKKKKIEYETRLNKIDIDLMSNQELIHFSLTRSSFIKLYKNLHNHEPEEVYPKIKLILEYCSVVDLINDIRICYLAAVETDRPTYSFNLYLIDIIERLYSDAEYYSLKESTDYSTDKTVDSQPILHYTWVLLSNRLSPYQRYLLFEYFVMGYSIEILAARRYCTTKSIMNHLHLITDLFLEHSLD